MIRTEEFTVSLGANAPVTLNTSNYTQVVIGFSTSTGTVAARINMAGLGWQMVNFVPLSTSMLLIFTRSQSGYLPPPASGSASAVLPLTNNLTIQTTVACTCYISDK